jgi:putative two-component system response regulator
LGCQCDEARDGAEAVDAALSEHYDVILLDLNLPDADGYEVCHKIREKVGRPHLKIIVISGRGDSNQLAEALSHGADDYIAKPFAQSQFQAKVRHALGLKEMQERADALARQLLQTNRQLESSLVARSQDVRLAQDALLFAMTKMAETRDDEDSGHLRRLQFYVHCLARHAAGEAIWAEAVDPAFLEQLERCVPLHDIGKIGVPEKVLHKPGRLDAAERAIMQTHAVIGTGILESLAREHGDSLEFLSVARALVRYHHERYDGTGYPDGLAGLDIPPAARLVAVADVYDALRRKRFHKSELSHAESIQILCEQSPGHFDPVLLRAFSACHHEFDEIYHGIRM